MLCRIMVSAISTCRRHHITFGVSYAKARYRKQPNRRLSSQQQAAAIAAPTALGAKECPTAGMDWITMSLEDRNLAYNNVEHVGPENARKKTEGWAAASKTLREQ